jgi:hypothetical protein
MSRIARSFAAAASAIAIASLVTAAPGLALTAKECSAKYNAAKTGGTLGTTTWNEFRKIQCAGDTATAPTSASGQAKTSPAVPVIKAPALAATGAVFPKAIAGKYASETAGRARMHTCRDQYQANKISNGNGGLKWIMKGGGYYSLCNKALKSAA